MEYTIKKLAEIAGISTRTLRYYDEIGLLSPCRINTSGYRIYGENEINILQQILFYRELDMKLEDIQRIITDTNFDINKALVQHHEKLIAKRNQLDQLILTVEKTLSHNKGEIKMSNNEKFEGLKKQKLAENEAKYGKEIREKYGNDSVKASNNKFMNLSEEDFNSMNKLESEMFQALSEVIQTKDLNSQAAKIVFENHKAWLCHIAPFYSTDYHIGLAEMYIADERFSKYYNDKAGNEATKTLYDIIMEYSIRSY